jgi:YbbR domain-containing protein
VTKTYWPFRHFGLKVISFGIAVLLWMVVSGEETVERGLRVPLELQQFPAGLEIQGEAPSTVDVRVRGTSGALSRVSAGDIVAVLDLHAARAGNRLFPITPEQVRVPFGVDVVQVTPSTVALAFENSASRQVPIVASLEGKPAPGYLIGKVTISPDHVDVVGPESAIKRVTEALTEPVSVAGAREQVVDVVRVGFVDPALRLRSQRTATVTIDVAPAPLERVLRGRPVHLLNLASNLAAEANPSVVEVGVRGSREVLARLEPDDVAASVDVAGLGPGDYTLNVHADAGEVAGVARINPASIQVRIARAKN